MNHSNCNEKNYILYITILSFLLRTNFTVVKQARKTIKDEHSLEIDYQGTV